MAARIGGMNPYDLHKHLINEYILKRPGDTKLLQRDGTKDKTDMDVIRENHRFLWDESSEADTWEKQLAKKYYDKLFKEYCICDLSRYKENKVAMRWRIEKEVVIGKGQFICGNKICNSKDQLRSWELNFAYIEGQTKKNALVKLRLCPDCSTKVNYHSKKREVKRQKRKPKSSNPSQQTKNDISTVNDESITTENDVMPIDLVSQNMIREQRNEEIITSMEKDCWSQKPTDIEDKTREEEFNEYLEDLLL